VLIKVLNKIASEVLEQPKPAYNYSITHSKVPLAKLTVTQLFKKLYVT
jgi:hypothetical protein